MNLNFGSNVYSHNKQEEFSGNQSNNKKVIRT